MWKGLSFRSKYNEKLLERSKPKNGCGLRERGAPGARVKAERGWAVVQVRVCDGLHQVAPVRVEERGSDDGTV